MEQNVPIEKWFENHICSKINVGDRSTPKQTEQPLPLQNVPQQQIQQKKQQQQEEAEKYFQEEYFNQAAVRQREQQKSAARARKEEADRAQKVAEDRALKEQADLAQKAAAERAQKEQEANQEEVLRQQEKEVLRQQAEEVLRQQEEATREQEPDHWDQYNKDHGFINWQEIDRQIELDQPEPLLEWEDDEIPQPLLKNQKEFRLLTLNVEEFHEIHKNAQKLQKFYALIVQVDADVILLQEDTDTVPAPIGYKRVAVCNSHRGYNELLQNSILVKTTDNSVLGALSGPLFQAAAAPERCYSACSYRGIDIATLHLSGGRFEDERFQDFLTLRDQQVAALKKFDIVAGDFNCHPLVSVANHPIYQQLKNPEDQANFEVYMRSGHLPLLEAGLTQLQITEATDSFGGKSDNVYYNGKKLRVKKIDYLKTMGAGRGTDTFYTDHNGIIVDFEILNTHPFSPPFLPLPPILF